MENPLSIFALETCCHLSTIVIGSCSCDFCVLPRHQYRKKSRCHYARIARDHLEMFQCSREGFCVTIANSLRRIEDSWIKIQRENFQIGRKSFLGRLAHFASPNNIFSLFNIDKCGYNRKWLVWERIVKILQLEVIRFSNN